VTERLEITGDHAISVGASVQLSARVLDQNNNVLNRTVGWSSSNNSIATVNPTTGLVTGTGTGTARITASAGSLTNSVEIPVMSLSPLQITAVAPAVLRAGTAVTITGTGFSSDIPSNLVTVSGERMQLTSASETTLQFTVPADVCLPAGMADMRVTVAAQQTGPFPQPFELTGSVTTVSVAAGQQQILSAAAGACLRFAAAASGESYLIGVQAVTEDVRLVTPVHVGGSVAGVIAVPQLQPAPQVRAGDIANAAFTLSPRARQRARQRAAEMVLRESEAKWVRTRGLVAARSAPAADLAGTIPGDIREGDIIAVRVPKRANNCEFFTDVAAEVRLVGDHAVWLEDVSNPDGPLALLEYENANSQFEAVTYPVNTAYFGNAADIDGNGRTAILISKEVNRDGASIAFVSLADYFPRTGPNSCPSSNTGEIIYLRAADALGRFGQPFTLDFLLDELFINVAHEMVHTIQFGRRRATPGAEIPTPWELEGQALIGEEINGHAETGRSTRQNYGFAVAFAGTDATGVAADRYPFYVDKFFDLMFYYGMQCSPTLCDPATRAVGAPEQCSWLALQQNGNTGPCDSEMRPIYGVPWLIMRWLTDQFAARFPDGEAGLHRALIDHTESGFSTLADVAGVPINELLAQWSAALYVDDRITGAADRLTMPSWNLFNIESRLIATAHLSPRQRGFSNFVDDISVRGGSTAYFLLSGPRPEFALNVKLPTGGALPAHMQVWIVRLQ
jgi:hypothetical protein